MNVRIKDLAKHLDLSESTVSRALSNHPRISENTKIRVKEAAKNLNYRPNLIAKSLKLQSTRTIGLIIGDITNPFYPDIVKSAEEIAHQNDFNIILCNSDYDAEKELQSLNILIGKRVDGMLITPEGNIPTLQSVLEQNNVPFILIDIKPTSKNDVNCVYADLEYGAYTAVEYLIGLGHERIALIHGPQRLSPSRQLITGYKRALGHGGIPVHKHYMRECNLKMAGGYNAMKALLVDSKSTPPTAVLFISDTTAIGAYDAIGEKRMAIPEDISIIGYDDIPEAKHLSPPLTTIAQPRYELGETAIALLLKALREEGRLKHQSVRLLPELIVRKSTAPLKE